MSINVNEWRDGNCNRGASQNHHPTVKPIELMRYLVRLTKTPTGGGVVLDPFTGSGTTGIACVLEGREFIGIEREAEYVEIAEKRIAHYRLPILEKCNERTRYPGRRFLCGQIYGGNRHPELKWFHAIPNGGQRNKAVAAKLKAEGVQRGIPDAFLPYPANGKHGLYIEFKNGTNKLTPEQKEFLETAEQNGYAVGVAYTADEALKILEDYLGRL